MVKIGNINLGEYPVILAPMEEVTDPPFRSVCKEAGADLVYTEFISSEGLIRDIAKSMKKLYFGFHERPVGIQIFGNNADSMVEAAHIAEAANPDLIDINWGCSVRKVSSKGSGAGILKDIPKMVSITSDVVKTTRLPVTVKTRLGLNEENKNIVEIAERLQDVGIQAISIHGRTKDQLYKGDADWVTISKVKENPRIIIPVFGNGDINSAEKAAFIRKTYLVDGIMIGRAAIGYPWIFREIKHYFQTGSLLPPPSVSERVKTCVQHLKGSVEWKGERTAVLEMRKHYSSYFRGLPDFKPFRVKLVTVEKFEEVVAICNQIDQKYGQINSLSLT